MAFNSASLATICLRIRARDKIQKWDTTSLHTIADGVLFWPQAAGSLMIVFHCICSVVFSSGVGPLCAVQSAQGHITLSTISLFPDGFNEVIPIPTVKLLLLPQYTLYILSYTLIHLEEFGGPCWLIFCWTVPQMPGPLGLFILPHLHRHLHQLLLLLLLPSNGNARRVPWPMHAGHTRMTPART